MLRRATFLCCFLFLAASTVFGQGEGTILGTVTDPSGLPVPNAKVTVMLTARGITQSMNTDKTGDYIFSLMPVGEYTLTAEQQGFRTFRQMGIVLTANANVRIDAQLQVGGVVQQVTVSAQGSPVDTHSSVVGTLIDQQKITEIPLNGRNVVSLAALLPGVTDINAPIIDNGDRNGPTVSVSGSRIDENLFLFDGTMFVALFVNSGENYPPPDSLEEAKVLTNNFSAEYGHNAGTVFNVVTKSGTNQIHGAGWEFLRNTDLNARDFFQAQRAGLIQNQYGGDVGGPIRKNKLFFFGDFEGVNIRPASVPVTGFPLTADQRSGYFPTSGKATYMPGTTTLYPTAPCPSAPSTNCYYIGSTFDPVAVNLVSGSNPYMPLPNAPGGEWVSGFSEPSNDYQFLVKLDYNIGSRHRLFSRYNYNYNNAVGYDGGVPAFQTYPTTMGVHTFAEGWTFTISPNLLNEFRFSFLHQATRGTFSGIGSTMTIQKLGGQMPAFPDPMPVPGFNLSGLISVGSGTSNVGSGLNRIVEFNDMLNWTNGRQVIKAGGQFLWMVYRNASYWQVAPQFTFSGYATGNPAADFMLGLPSALIFASPILSQFGNDHAAALFVQDDIKVNRKLTVNLGLH
jgi:hypothetical protein